MTAYDDWLEAPYYTEHKEPHERDPDDERDEELLRDRLDELAEPDEDDA